MIKREKTLMKTIYVIVRPLGPEGAPVGAELMASGVLSYDTLNALRESVDGEPPQGRPCKLYGAPLARLLLSQPDAGAAMRVGKGHSRRLGLRTSHVQAALLEADSIAKQTVSAVALPLMDHLRCIKGDALVTPEQAALVEELMSE